MAWAEAALLWLGSPLRAAAAGVALTALVVLFISLSDAAMRRLAPYDAPEDRAERRHRFRGHVILLIGLAIGLVLLSKVIQ